MVGMYIMEIGNTQVRLQKNRVSFKLHGFCILFQAYRKEKLLNSKDLSNNRI